MGAQHKLTFKNIAVIKFKIGTVIISNSADEMFIIQTDGRLLHDNTFNLVNLNNFKSLGTKRRIQ